MNWLKKIATASGTEGKFTSLGVMGPVVALILLAVNTWWGDELIPVHGAELAINNSIAVVGFVVGIYGRVRAKKNISTGELLK